MQRRRIGSFRAMYASRSGQLGVKVTEEQAGTLAELRNEYAAMKYEYDLIVLQHQAAASQCTAYDVEIAEVEAAGGTPSQELFDAKIAACNAAAGLKESRDDYRKRLDALAIEIRTLEKELGLGPGEIPEVVTPGTTGPGTVDPGTPATPPPATPPPATPPPATPPPATPPPVATSTTGTGTGTILAVLGIIAVAAGGTWLLTRSEKRKANRT